MTAPTMTWQQILAHATCWIGALAQVDLADAFEDHQTRTFTASDLRVLDPKRYSMPFIGEWAQRFGDPLVDASLRRFVVACAERSNPSGARGHAVISGVLKAASRFANGKADSDELDAAALRACELYVIGPDGPTRLRALMAVHCCAPTGRIPATEVASIAETLALLRQSNEDEAEWQREAFIATFSHGCVGE